MKRFEQIQSNKQNIGNACKTVRLEHNITIDNFASLTGVSKQTIINFESGKHMSLDLFMKYYALSIGGFTHEKENNETVNN